MTGCHIDLWMLSGTPFDYRRSCEVSHDRLSSIGALSIRELRLRSAASPSAMGLAAIALSRASQLASPGGTPGDGNGPVGGSEMHRRCFVSLMFGARRQTRSRASSSSTETILFRVASFWCAFLGIHPLQDFGSAKMSSATGGEGKDQEEERAVLRVHQWMELKS